MIPTDERDHDTQELPGPRARVDVDAAARSHPGKLRTNNEDHFLVGRIARSLEVLASNLPNDALPPLVEQSGYCLVVADGMGGAAAGEVASRVAIEAGLQLHLSRASWFLRVDAEAANRILERMHEVLLAADSAVVARAERDERLAGMGTTMTLAFAIGADLFVAHVGDSRAYLLHEGKLLQLTQDQTVAQELVSIGRIPPAQAARHPLRHVLTHAVGEGGAKLAVELFHLWLADGDHLLLCSDGLHDVVEDEAIEARLAAAPSADEACRTLIEAALAGGGPDNVTAVVARFRVPPGANGGPPPIDEDDTAEGAPDPEETQPGRL